MRTITKEKITLCLLIGLFVFAISAPLMTTGVLQERTLERYDTATPAYTPHDAILLHSNDEMIAQATAETWPGDGSAGNPYQITGYSFYDVQHSVEIRNIDLHWTFTDNEIDGPYDGTVWCGMEITNSTNGYVANNVITGRFRGLWLIDIYEVTITNNLIVDNLFHGIECVGFINACLISENIMTGNTGSGMVIKEAVDSEISRNNITENGGTGIQILTKATNCQITDNHVENVPGLGINIANTESVEIMHNELTNVNGAGICAIISNDIEIYNNTIIDGGDNGIYLKDSSFGLIHSNSIIGSDEIGIMMDSGENCTFRFNHVEDSSDYGFKTAAESECMEITQNVFINNSATGSQVYDEGGNNTYIYNYYDEWISPDADSDLIVDVPYVIDGDADNEDPYPLADPDAIPPETDDPPTVTGGVPIPMEILLIAGGAVVIILVGVVFVKRRA